MKVALHSRRLLVLLATALVTVQCVIAASQSEPQYSPTERAARAQLEIGLIYESDGRYADAESAFARAIADGDAETSRTAKDGLRRVIALRGSSTSAESQIALGKAYEKEGRLADAEAAYAKAAEAVTLATRTEAMRLARNIIERRESLYEKHLRPFIDALAKSATPILFVVLAFLIIPPPIKALARRRQKNALGIFGFGTAGDTGLGNDIDYLHERMSRYFQSRTIAGDAGPRMPVLLQAGSSEFVELLGSVSAASVPFAKWILGLLQQPAYRITGSSGTTLWEANVRVKLEHKGEIIAQWNRTYPIPGSYTLQRDLAYEVLLTLKRYVDRHAP